MKSLTFLFLLVLGMIELWVLGSHCVCREERPQRNAYGVTRQVALATPSESSEREPADGLPVPIYPGTRVDTAEIQPPHATTKRLSEAPTASRLSTRIQGQTTVLSMVEHQVVRGQISATETRARNDARVQLQHQVTAWLASDIPAAWKPPAPLIDRLIVRTELEPVEKDYGTLYKATLHVDSTPARRAELIAAYQHELVVRRMGLMGGGLAGILTCLAALAGYIRADEATKGYYTNWLRAAAAAGVGASGVLIYQVLT
ncbi:hypothetical protein SAMN05444166_5199 [Singulisphaera sp. GP187]|uniref:hypothetical protein n=1 Tax=Singulisphaera sp. GP187 TaxID=1882752 RepID=UPI000928FD31|nr:hypothetical protein [Singulisphaera sp. GP187]SIO56197.1 hypothetical protein SAMN05444166_5199 [Singulisphaera sp. GP187]